MDDNTLYKINYWELPGHHKSSGYFFRYCLGSTAAIYLFDSKFEFFLENSYFLFKVSKRSSFEKIEAWINENEKCDIPIKLLVGNKVNLNETREE